MNGNDSDPLGSRGVLGMLTAFVGVDLHKCTVSLAAVEARGEMIDRLKISTKCVDRIEQWLKKLPGPAHLFQMRSSPFLRSEMKSTCIAGRPL